MIRVEQRPTRHSYSSMKKWQECPAAYRYSYILKMADPPNAAMMRGSRLHKLAEDYMNADPSEPVPYDIKKIGLKLYQLREAKAKPEVTWLVDSDWQPVKRQEHAKLKAIIDVHRMDGEVLRLHDYKSGREYPSHTDQLEFYAAMGLCHYPDAKRAESSAIYFDSGYESNSRSVIRDMLPYLRTKWMVVATRIDNDQSFYPTPGGHCARCNFGISKGGPCDAEQRT
jgi:hypothetical protein